MLWNLCHAFRKYKVLHFIEPAKSIRTNAFQLRPVLEYKLFNKRASVERTRLDIFYGVGNFNLTS